MLGIWASVIVLWVALLLDHVFLSVKTVVVVLLVDSLAK